MWYYFKIFQWIVAQKFALTVSILRLQKNFQIFVFWKLFRFIFYFLNLISFSNYHTHVPFWKFFLNLGVLLQSFIYLQGVQGKNCQIEIVLQWFYVFPYYWKNENLKLYNSQNEKWLFYVKSRFLKIAILTIFQILNHRN